MRRVALGLCLAANLGCRASPAKVIAYDLAERLPVAELWSSREVILFGTPAAEPHLAEGFFREAGAPEGDRFAWAGREAEVSFTWPEPAARAGVVDVAPYAGTKGQTAEVFLNGTPVAKLALNDSRFRYALALPATAQRPGENRLRFVFARTASPSQADPKNPDERQLAAAFYAMSVGAADDRSLDDLLARNAARPFALAKQAGVPEVEMAGPAVARFALRLPEAAELRFTPELHAAARAAAAAASFRITIEAVGGAEREIWSRVLDAKHAGHPSEVALPLPGKAGDVVRLGLHTGGAPGARFAWGVWHAPRVLGAGVRPGVESSPYSADDDRRAEGLRRSLKDANVVLVILDAGRAAQFGAYGYGRATTPEIDRIAAEGVVFEEATTPAVYTLGAMSSVWTSQYPDRHHSEVSFSARLPKDRLTLAELLSGRGLESAGFVANAVAGRSFGFERGFTTFREILHGVAGDFVEVVPAWVRKHLDQRFFLYLHFREPHFPYDPPAPFDTAFGPDGPIPKASRSDAKYFDDLKQGRRQAVPGEIDHLVRLYDGNLAYADEQIGRLRKQLEDAGLWDRSLVIVAADHGEELFEHGWIGHNVHLYEQSVRVPLVVKLPKAAGIAGRRISGLVDLLDLAPSIADAFGVRPLPASFEGRSLLPMIAGAPGKAAVLSRTVWDRPRYALREGGHKYIYDTRSGEQELFDLAADPKEERNLAPREPVLSAFYRQTLYHWITRLARREHAGGEQASLTRQQCENLKALGYLDAKTPCPKE